MSKRKQQSETGSAAQQVYAALREGIISREHGPGDVLSRPDLARRYGTSPTPVREALLRLEAEGFVRVRPQSGTVVAPIRVLELHQAMFLRRALEERVVRRLAARRARPDLTALRTLAGAAVTPEADIAFHHGLFAAVGMDALHTRTQPLLAACERFRAVSPRKEAEAQAEHDDIVTRIEQGDPDGAAQAMGAHLASELQNLDAVRRAHPAMFSDD